MPHPHGSREVPYRTHLQTFISAVATLFPPRYPSAQPLDVLFRTYYTASKTDAFAIHFEFPSLQPLLLLSLIHATGALLMALLGTQECTCSYPAAAPNSSFSWSHNTPLIDFLSHTNPPPLP